MEQTIVYRGHKIVSCIGGWQIAGYDKSVFVTPDAAKQHIALLERPQMERYIMVGGQHYELSNVTAVSLLPNGKFGLAVSYKPAGGVHLR